MISLNCDQNSEKQQNRCSEFLAPFAAVSKQKASTGRNVLGLAKTGSACSSAQNK